MVYRKSLAEIFKMRLQFCKACLKSHFTIICFIGGKKLQAPAFSAGAPQSACPAPALR